MATALLFPVTGVHLRPATAGETVRRVKDIYPGFKSGYPQETTLLGRTLLFSAEDAGHGRELWRSDGTDAGTVLVKDIRSGVLSSAPLHLTRAGSTLYFAAFDDAHGYELWKSDGTDAGTTLVKDIDPGTAGSTPACLFAVGRSVFFRATDGTTGYELWMSDGTEAGTVLVKDISAGSGSGLPDVCSDPPAFARFQGAVYFQATDGVIGKELWRSDGTDAGTVLVKDIRPGNLDSDPFDFTVLGSLLMFSAADDVHGRELWRTDGTAGGTVMVKDILPIGSASSGPLYLTALGNLLVFSATVSEDDGLDYSELWSSDGTEAGTVNITPDDPPHTGFVLPQALTAVGRWVVFAASREPGLLDSLWKTNGTRAGTVFLKDLSVYAPTATFLPLGRVAYFAASDGVSGNELWKTDLTPGGTVLAADVWPGLSSSNPVYLTVASRSLFFTANDGTSGTELWALS
jgi:ELWxxDGT repeat protein